MHYEEQGETNSKLQNAASGYKKVKYLEKTTDGMFSVWNLYLSQLLKYLEQEEIGSLIIMGANGGSCVADSIIGLLESQYQVIAFSDGIADFNFRNFEYPYNFLKYLNFDCDGCQFHEVDELGLIKVLDKVGKKLNLQAYKAAKARWHSDDSWKLEVGSWKLEVGLGMGMGLKL